MNSIEFIEKYCRIKDKNGNILKIHFSDAQKKLVKHFEKLRLWK